MSPFENLEIFQSVAFESWGDEENKRSFPKSNQAGETKDLNSYYIIVILWKINVLDYFIEMGLKKP